MRRARKPIGLQSRLTRRAWLALLAAAAAGCARSEAGTRAEVPFDPAALTLAYPAGEMLVDPGWLRDRLDDPNLRLYDLSDLPGYRDGHIPGAAHFWWQDLIEIHNPVYGMLLGPDGRARVMRAAGIEPGSTLVCYDRSGGRYASRLLWVLRYMGFPRERAHLLVGGLQGWVEAGGELSREAHAYAPSASTLDDARDETVNANSADILARLGEPGLAILDTRSAADQRETWRGQLREGRIPGSVHLPREDFLLDGPVPALVRPEVLSARLAAVGLDLAATTEIIVYDLHATLAALPWLALTALGGPHVRLYDGSWADWGSNRELPLEPLPGDGE